MKKYNVEERKPVNTLKASILSSMCGIALGLIISPVWKGEETTEKVRSNIPVVRENQSLILHPDYLNGNAALGYTLLTDLDYSGDWDLAERNHAGYTTGDGGHKLYFKKGFGPSQSVKAEVEFVKTEFFRPYQ
jgi:hypothetical protein